MAILSAARYGKDNVRVYKVHRDEAAGTQSVTEMTVCCLLEGQIEESYTRADNSVVVATDSIKNTIYIKAKEHPVNPPELYAGILGQHFLDTYPHISAANVSVVVHRWTRMVIDGKPHPHSFLRDGEETRNVEARVTRGAIDVAGGISKLLVLKSTNSQFHGFVRDEFTTLQETWDRILSTDVDATWKWATFPDLAALREGVPAFDKAWEDARNIALKTFAEENSPSVQNTMYKISEKILDAAPGVASVSLALPNKHYFEIGKFFESFPPLPPPRCGTPTLLTENLPLRRPIVAQRSQEHRQGRGGLRPSVRTQRSHQVRGLALLGPDLMFSLPSYGLWRKLYYAIFRGSGGGRRGGACNHHPSSLLLERSVRSSGVHLHRPTRLSVDTIINLRYPTPLIRLNMHLRL